MIASAKRKMSETLWMDTKAFIQNADIVKHHYGNNRSAESTTACMLFVNNRGVSNAKQTT